MTSTPPTDADRIELQRAVVAEHCRAESAGDWEAVFATFAADGSALWDAVPLSMSAPGLDGVRGVYALVSAAFPDMNVAITAEYDVPGVSVVEATIRGTHSGDWCGLPGSGRRVSVEVCAVFVFGEGENAGKLVCERAYWDNETLLRQMRGEKGAPVGVGLAHR